MKIMDLLWRATNVVFTRARTPEFGGEVEFICRPKHRDWGYRIDRKHDKTGLSNFFQKTGITPEDCYKAFGFGAKDPWGINAEIYPAGKQSLEKIAEDREMMTRFRAYMSGGKQAENKKGRKK